MNASTCCSEKPSSSTFASNTDEADWKKFLAASQGREVARRHASVKTSPVSSRHTYELFRSTNSSTPSSTTRIPRPLRARMSSANFCSLLSGSSGRRTASSCTSDVALCTAGSRSLHNNSASKNDHSWPSEWSIAACWQVPVLPQPAPAHTAVLGCVHNDWIPVEASCRLETTTSGPAEEDACAAAATVCPEVDVVACTGSVRCWRGFVRRKRLWKGMVLRAWGRA